MKPRSIVPDPGILRLLGVEIRHNFFPERLLNQLTERILTQTHRKEKFGFTHGKFPSPIDQAAELITATFGPERLNVAILKRYVVGEPSEAFKAHRDPEEFNGRLFFCSLSGQALLKVFSPDMKITTEVLCTPNTVVVAPANILHRISEPYKDEGTRCFLFFGHSDLLKSF